MHFFSLFGPTFNINTSADRSTIGQPQNVQSSSLSLPRNLSSSSLPRQNSYSNLIPSEIQSVLQTIIPNLNAPVTTRAVENNNNTPANSIIMVYEDLTSQQQSSGLNLTEIHQVSHLVLNEKEEENEELKTCSICQQSIDWDVIIRKINICNHEYHVNCIDQWLVDHNTCPTCRRELNSSSTTESTNSELPNSSYQFRIPTTRNS